MPHTWDPDVLSPQQALDRLMAGNRRFREGNASPIAQTFRPELATEAQRPFAIVLGCSDSRMPVEIIFDEGSGAIFVVRIAGNVIAPSGVGSIEFAASQFGTRLVVVLGHTRCGAVTATVKALQDGQSAESKNIRSITDRISPHVRHLVERGPSDRLIPDAVRENVRASVEQLHHASALVEELVDKGRLAVVGAEYELETGTVHKLPRDT